TITSHWSARRCTGNSSTSPSRTRPCSSAASPAARSSAAAAAGPAGRGGGFSFGRGLGQFRPVTNRGGGQGARNGAGGGGGKVGGVRQEFGRREMGWWQR